MTQSEAVLLVLADGKCRKASDILEEIYTRYSIYPGCIYALLCSMLKKDKVIRVGKGVYALNGVRLYGQGVEPPL